MRSFFSYRGFFKKVLSLILVGIVFFSTITNVYASTLTIDDVSKQFNKSTFIQVLAELGSTYISKINASEKKLDIYEDDEKIFSFTYGDDYIEYNNRNFVVTQENCMEDFATVFWLGGIIESILVLSGYENKTLSEDGDYTNSYDTYGIQLENESYNFSSEDDSLNISGNYIKYFKMSLDTEKIDALVTKYGMDAEKQDSNKELINSLTPSLRADNITENSVTLYPSVPYTNDDDYTVTCFVYRSDSENGTYEKISDWAVNCSGSIGVVDEGLKTDTTYYYKTIVNGGVIYSSPLKVTTKRSSIMTDNNIKKDNNYQEDTIENPKTGVVLPVVTIILVIIGSITAMFYIKKKNLFKQI